MNAALQCQRPTDQLQLRYCGGYNDISMFETAEVAALESTKRGLEVDEHHFSG